MPGYKRVYLKCGGPKHSSKPAWGYRHILKYHRRDWEQLAAQSTYQSWRDIADHAMAWALIDPAVRGPLAGGKRCFSRTISLYDNRGRFIKHQIVRIVFRVSDRAVITTYPSKKHCETRRDAALQ